MMIIKNVTQYVIKRGLSGSFSTLFFLMVIFVFNPTAFAAENMPSSGFTQSQGQEIIYACPMHPIMLSRIFSVPMKYPG
jgi:hypothetical protein